MDVQFVTELLGWTSLAGLVVAVYMVAWLSLPVNK